MKKVLQKTVYEKAVYFCDVHPNIECFTEIQGISWYGSKFDSTGIKFHLCDECLTDFYKDITEKYKIKIQEINI